jgi:hypothetical protein
MLLHLPCLIGNAGQNIRYQQNNMILRGPVAPRAFAVVSKLDRPERSTSVELRDTNARR